MAKLGSSRESLLHAAGELAACLERDGEPSHRVTARLRSSVLRPLRAGHRDESAATSISSSELDPADLPERLWALALDATDLRAALTDDLPLVEAAAALQDLALEATAPGQREERLAELTRRQAALQPAIQVAPDGPYLVTNAHAVEDWLGCPLPVRPQMALCRCGASGIKPLCDGSHATAGFSGDKDPNRVPDRRDTYVGQQVTILDNRGVCQHAGRCTDRIADVFRAGQDPFVAPSGGRMDEIIRAVRDCPSGALSYAIDGVEARADVDFHGTRDPVIEVSKDGPYRIRGGIPLIDENGEAVARNAGASREHYALCRCGQSQNKPFCSGMHWYVSFRDPEPEPDAAPTIFEWAGGLPALTRMTRLFYEKHVPQDPLLAPVFSMMSADHPQRVAKWLAEVFGGPKRYSAEHGGYPHMLAQHRGRGLTEEQRARWVALLLKSAQEAGLPNDAEFRSAFGSYIEWGSRLAVENSQSNARPPEHMPMPSWDWNTAAGPPGSRPAVLASVNEADDEPPALPGDDEPVSFEAHIKPLFRQLDRRSMQFAFDLWSHDDVSGQAEPILERLRAGTMPCDGAWPAERVAVFERWIREGKRA